MPPVFILWSNDVSFTKAQLEKRKVEEREVNGRRTFFVDGKPYCLGTKPSDKNLCGNPAGKGTDHFGSGRCKFHGGCAGRPVSSGEKAVIAKKDLAQIYQELRANEPELLDLKNELAMLKTALNHVFGLYLEDQTPELEVRAATLTNEIGKLSAKMGAKDPVMTAQSAKYLMLKAVDVAKTLCYQWWADDEVAEQRLAEFLSEWRSVMVTLEQNTQR